MTTCSSPPPESFRQRIFFRIFLIVSLEKPIMLGYIIMSAGKENKMPVFEMVNGWAITIYLNDHNPIHFHAKKAGVSVRIFLNGTFEVEGHAKISPADRNRLLKFARDNQTKIEEFWNELH